MKLHQYILLLMLTGCHTTSWPGSSLHSVSQGNSISQGTCSEGVCTKTACKTHCPNSLHGCGLMGGTCEIPISCNQDWKTKHIARKIAARHMPHGVKSHDFKEGYYQAFEDVAMGASGQVPALPPKKYWTEKGRTCKGHAKAQQWFEGYAAGAEIAVSVQDRFLDVASHYCGSININSYSQVVYE